MSETPTPNTMPGANPPVPQESPTTPAPTPEKTVKPEKAAETGPSAEDKAELERLRAFRKEAQKWEERAKTNFDDAERWRQLSKTVGGDTKEFDPQAEFQKLRDEVTRERTERTRAEVARAEDVDPDIIIGETEEQMRESAQRYKSKVEAAIEKALKGRASAAAPASEVTANGKVAGPGQIQSREQLKNMTPKQIREAQEAGLLDDLLSGKTT